MIVAEIGQNWCGKPELACKLIRLAKENGADLCKFQLYDHAVLYKDHPEIPDVSLTYDMAEELFDYGVEVGIEVFFSVFDVERVKWCEKIGVKRYKLSCNGKYKVLVDAILLTKKPIISSASNNPFVSEWEFYLLQKNVTWLYCIPDYPTELKLLPNFKNSLFKGFSDHTIGLDASKIALARGAQIIEKHFCIDHQTGIDAEWSMTPEELKELKRWSDICRQVL